MDSLDKMLMESAREAQEVIVLVDGDMVVYRPAAKADGRQYRIQNRDEVFLYKADVDAFCKDNDVSLRDIYIAYEPEPLSHALEGVKSLMQMIKNHFDYSKVENNYTFKYEIYMGKPGDKSNFRFDINPTYKNNRIGVRKPFHLNSCKEFMITTYGAEYVTGMEADDMLTIRAAELGNQQKKFVIASGDKDLKQFPGEHYDWAKRKQWTISEAEAKQLLWMQVITGDTTDSIITPDGMGKAKGKAKFADVDWEAVTDEEMFVLCTELYSEWMAKCGAKKKRMGWPATIDFTDVRCYVEEIYRQVYLLRSLEEVPSFE